MKNLTQEEQNILTLKSIVSSVLKAYNSDGSLKDGYYEDIILNDLEKSDIDFLKSLI